MTKLNFKIISNDVISVTLTLLRHSNKRHTIFPFWDPLNQNIWLRQCWNTCIIGIGIRNNNNSIQIH